MKNTKWMFAMAIASGAMIPAVVVQADTTQDIADGTYEVNFLTYKTGTKETSGMANRFSQPATLIVENGVAKIQFSIITQNSMMGNLTIPYKGSNVDMTTISGTIDSEIRVVELPIDTFNQAVTVEVAVVFPGSATPVMQSFDLIVESPTTDSLVEEVNLTAYKNGTTEVSAMQQFINPTAKIQLQGEESIVYVTFTNKEFVAGFLVNGTKASIHAEENGGVTYKATVKNTKQLLDAVVDVNANGQAMQQKAQLHLAVKGAPVMIKNPFKDIDSNENKDAILNLLNKGIVKANDHYHPQKALTRSQFALMMARTLNLQAAPDAGFKDLATIKEMDADRYHAIHALAKAGIVQTGERFNPDATITRQQAALMIYRAMQYHVGTEALDFGNNMAVYEDAALVTNEESQRAFSFLYASKAMTGTVDKNGVRKIEPNKALTRSQMAKILNGTLKYLGH